MNDVKESMSFEHGGKTLHCSQELADAIAAYEMFRLAKGKLIEIGATTMFVREEFVTMRWTNLSNAIEAQYPGLSTEEKTDLIAHVVAQNPQACQFREGDVSKATKGCC